MEPSKKGPVSKKHGPRNRGESLAFLRWSA
jgi:hypothetical protein